MRSTTTVARFALVLALAVLAASPAAATTLMRAGLEKLTADNQLIVQGRVLDTRSYWNDEHTFIYTDVRVSTAQVLKGPSRAEVTFTLMGGTVGDITTLIIGGPNLLPGSEYVFFLSRGDLAGGVIRLTVRDLAQGVFDVITDRTGRQVVFSQALHDPLLPDPNGIDTVPGGEQGMPLEQLVREVRTLNVGR